MKQWFRIILIKNKKQKKVILRSDNKDTIFLRYKELIDKSDNVLFPKKHINYKTIKPVKYELLLAKKREPGDKNRLIRNQLGQIVEEKTSTNKWVILDSHPLQLEETFWVWGRDCKNDRFDARRIMKEILLVNIHKNFMVKQVVVIKNKVVIQSDNVDVHLIVCKNIEDAIHLHNILAKAISKTKIKNILFMGVVVKSKQVRTLYKIIRELTGWDSMQVRRFSTRH